MVVAGDEPGFVRKRKVLKLVFDDPEMEGLVVRAGSLSMGELMDLTKLAELRKAPGIEGVNAARGLIEKFSAALRMWNLRDEDGVPVPTTAEALLAEDPEFVIGVILAWMDANAGVSGPLARRSSGGEPFPEGSIPMASPSANPPS